MAREPHQNQKTPTPTDCPVILHISDLHFGYDENPQRKDDRNLALNYLADRIISLDKAWHPKYICITGDIGYYGAASDYELVSKWLINFLKKLEVPVNSVFMCPGNHDVNRDIAKKDGRPNSPEEADIMLGLPLSPHFINHIFAGYIGFQDSIKVPQYEVGADDDGSYLYGVRQTCNGLRFICCNSCWYSKDDNDRKNLWIGGPLLRSLDSRKMICRRSDSQTIDVALIHHPKDWLRDYELNTLSQRRAATFDYLAKMSHIVLTGHTHADLRKWDQNEHEAYVCGGGASWVSISHPNTFRLIRIDKEKQIFEYSSFQWNSSQYKWQEVLINEQNMRFFQNKVEDDLASACQSQGGRLRTTKPAKKSKLKTPREKLPYETSIDKNSKITDVPAGSHLIDTEDITINSAARSIINELNKYKRVVNYSKAAECWEKNQNWFAKNKGKMDTLLAKEIDLLVEEIYLFLE